MVTAIFTVFLLMTVVMTVGWIFQRAVNNGGWTDVFWTYGTGASCAIAALFSSGSAEGVDWRALMVAGMIGLWALRLGTYVALRVAKSSEDARYHALREEWGVNFQRNMFVLLVSQAPITAALSVAVVLAARRPGAEFTLADLAGALVLIIAVIGETIADRQMTRFKSDPAHRGEVCDQGLWAWSRHPNYFFEALGWFAYPVIAFDPAHPSTAAALIAPVLMFAVVRFMTGVPPLEKAMLRSKGEAYRRYQSRVSPLLLAPPRGDPT